MAWIGRNSPPAVNTNRKARLTIFLRCHITVCVQQGSPVIDLHRNPRPMADWLCDFGRDYLTSLTFPLLMCENRPLKFLLPKGYCPELNKV